MRHLHKRSKLGNFLYLGLVVFAILVVLNADALRKWSKWSFRNGLYSPREPLSFMERLDMRKLLIGSASNFNITYKSTDTTNVVTNDVSVDEEAEVSRLANLLRERLAIRNDGQRTVYKETCTLNKYTKPCTDPNCTASINRTYEARISNILRDSPQLHLSEPQLDVILSLSAKIPNNDIIIVSAASKDHFNELQAMFQALHETIYPTLRNFSVVVYDLGLTEKQSTLAVASRAKKLVIWQDSSIRWRSGFKTVLQRAQLYGQQVIVTEHKGENARVTAHTMEEMFEYMNESICPYHTFPEIVNAVSLHRPDPLVMQLVLNPWARCALEAACMCPYNPIKIRRCRDMVNHACHRFDQSALTLLMAKLYVGEHYKMEVSQHWHHLDIKRGHTAAGYFSSPYK